MSSKLERLKQQREQLAARIQQIESQQKARERRQDTRRKILLGALLDEWMEKDETLKAKVAAHLQCYLVRKIDRDVFGLAPLPESPSESAGKPKARSEKAPSEKSEAQTAPDKEPQS